MRWKTACAAVAVAGVAVLGPLAWIRGWLAPWAIPVFGALSPGGMAAADTPDAVWREQVARLAGENAILRARLAEYAQIQGEGGVPVERVVVARARIISRTRRTGRRYLELDVGRVDGVAKGMPVSLGWTLIGQVAGTDDGRCLVQELTDSESRIAAALVDPGKDGIPAKRLGEGVLTGHGKRDEFTLDALETTADADVQPGLSVVTAGSDGRFPAGLVLGTVTRASHAGSEAWSVGVAPARDAELAESLLVLRFGR